MARRGKVQLQWIADRRARQKTFLKRRRTLLARARELSTKCDVRVAMVVYGGPGHEADPPATWPPAPETTAILQRYADSPDASKEEVELEDFLRERVEKLREKVEKMKLANHVREVNIVVDELLLGRRRNLDGLPDEIVADVKAEVERRMWDLSNLMKLPPQVVEPQAAVSGAAADAPPIDIDDWEPMNGSFFLEMVAAIMDDGSGRDFVPTAEDVERVLKEHGLFNNM